MFKVYLGNLDSKVTVETLTPLFEPFGEVEEIVIATDETGKSRGFAIILFRDPLKGQLAIETLSNKKINGRTVVINEAIKKGKKTQPADRMPRNTPLGPRAFPRVGGFGRGASGGGMRSASGGGRFVRNPRRLLNQPGAGGAPSAPAGAGGSSSPETSSGGTEGSNPPPSGPGPTSWPGAISHPVRPAAPRPAGGPQSGSPTPPPRAAQPSAQRAAPSRPAPAATPAPAKEVPAEPAKPVRPRAVKKAIPPSNPTGT